MNKNGLFACQHNQKQWMTYHLPNPLNKAVKEMTCILQLMACLDSELIRLYFQENASPEILGPVIEVNFELLLDA